MLNPYRRRDSGVKEGEKVKLVVRLRDEQHLTFKQIAVQVGKGINWCCRVYNAQK